MPSFPTFSAIEHFRMRFLLKSIERLGETERRILTVRSSPGSVRLSVGGHVPAAEQGEVGKRILNGSDPPGSGRWRSLRDVAILRCQMKGGERVEPPFWISGSVSGGTIGWQGSRHLRRGSSLSCRHNPGGFVDCENAWIGSDLTNQTSLLDPIKLR